MHFTKAPRGQARRCRLGGHRAGRAVAPPPGGPGSRGEAPETVAHTGSCRSPCRGVLATFAPDEEESHTWTPAQPPLPEGAAGKGPPPSWGGRGAESPSAPLLQGEQSPCGISPPREADNWSTAGGRSWGTVPAGACQRAWRWPRRLQKTLCSPVKANTSLDIYSRDASVIWGVSYSLTGDVSPATRPCRTDFLGESGPPNSPPGAP